MHHRYLGHKYASAYDRQVQGVFGLNLNSLNLLLWGIFDCIGLSTSCYEGGEYLTNRLPFHCEMKKNQVLKNMRTSLTKDLLTITLWQDWYTQGCCTSPYCNANMSLDTSHMFTIPGKGCTLCPFLLLSSVYVPLYFMFSITHPFFFFF